MISNYTKPIDPYTKAIVLVDVKIVGCDLVEQLQGNEEQTYVNLRYSKKGI